MNCTLSFAGWFLSPTRKIVDLLKGDAPDRRARVLIKFSLGFIWFEVLSSVAVIGTELRFPLQNNLFVYGPLLLYAFSRCNEISYAFYNDAIRQLSSEPQTSMPTRKDRVVMTMRSYLGLTLNFALLYYFFPVEGLFKVKMNGLFDAVYFSGVTVTTLGYGEIVPIHWCSRAMVLYQVFTGILLVVVAIGTYLGADANEPNPV
ncbi:Ion channel [Symmachiella dynata]|uniref:potassium channel family protein n=1 Tax=Symmachiella dynata TaxID=2527995 RepID=UPI00118D40E5|nr:potassium channel family protein [Symmachiella dynata]QDT49478.1 Ion channel [Symmachiella dynata]